MFSRHHNPFFIMKKGFLFPFIIILSFIGYGGVASEAAAFSTSKPRSGLFQKKNRDLTPFAQMQQPQTPPSNEGVDLGEMVVRDTQEGRLDETAAATDIVRERDAPLATSTVQMLEQSAGVTVRRYGGIDDFSALSLRGSTPGQVQIYLDEVPLLTAQGTLTDISIIPLNAIDHVEVYRGGAPGILPESAIGGVVVLRSKKRPEKFEWSANAGYGSFGTLRLGTSQAQPIKNMSYRFVYDFFRSDGNFTYLDNNGTTFNTGDDKEVTRQNNSFVQNTFFAKFDADLPDEWKLTFTDSLLDKSQGVPGLGSRESLNAHLKTLRNVASVDIDRKNLFTKNFNAHFNVFFDFLNSKFDDPQGEIGLAPQDNDDDTYRFGELARASYAYGKSWLTTMLVAHRGEYYLPHDSLGPQISGSNSSRQSLSVALEEDMRFWNERLVLSPSVRFEGTYNNLNDDSTGQHNSNDDQQISAKFGIKARLVDELYFKGNVYRGFRQPTFAELFGDRGELIGNPALEPEKAFNFDLGLAYKLSDNSWLSGARVEAAYFESNVDNLIQFLQTSQFTAKAQNLNKAHIQGVEASARATFFDRLALAANFTWQRAKDVSGTVTDGKYLPGRPQYQAGAMLTWREEWNQGLASSVTGELHYASGSYLDTQNLLEIKNQTIINTGVAFEIMKRATISFTARNITNDQIVDAVGYPLPGRSYWGSVEVKM